MTEQLAVLMHYSTIIEAGTHGTMALLGVWWIRLRKPDMMPLMMTVILLAPLALVRGHQITFRF